MMEEEDSVRRNGGVVDNDDDDEMKMAKQENPEKDRENEIKIHFVKSSNRQCVVVFGNCRWSLSGSKRTKRNEISFFKYRLVGSHHQSGFALVGGGVRCKTRQMHLLNGVLNRYIILLI